MPLQLHFRDLTCHPLKAHFSVNNNGDWGFCTTHAGKNIDFMKFEDFKIRTNTPMLEYASAGVPVSLADLAAELEEMDRESWTMNCNREALHGHNGDVVALDVDLTLTQYHCYGSSQPFKKSETVPKPGEIPQETFTFNENIREYKDLIKKDIQLPFKGQDLSPVEILKKGCPIFIITNGWYVQLLYQILKAVFAPLYDDIMLRPLLNRVIVCASTQFAQRMYGPFGLWPFEGAQCKSPLLKSMRLALALYKTKITNITELYFFDDDGTNVQDMKFNLCAQLHQAPPLISSQPIIHSYWVSTMDKQTFNCTLFKLVSKPDILPFMTIPSTLKAPSIIVGSVPSSQKETAATATAAPMTCPGCSEIISPRHVYCENCNTRLIPDSSSAAIPVTQKLQSRQAPFKTCAFCYNQTPQDFQFCDDCGRPLQRLHSVIPVTHTNEEINLKISSSSTQGGSYSPFQIRITKDKLNFFGFILGASYEVHINNIRCRNFIKFQYQKDLANCPIRAFEPTNSTNQLYIFIVGKREIACFYIENLNNPVSVRYKTTSFDYLIKQALTRNGNHTLDKDTRITDVVKTHELENGRTVDKLKIVTNQPSVFFEEILGRFSLPISDY